MTPYRQHMEKWRDCRLCRLWEGRRRVVFARGDVPADVVFVGEAPGASEDSLGGPNGHPGQPFVGPAGNLLDRMIVEAVPVVDWTIAFCNVVGCFPADAKGTDDHRPPAEAIKACRPKIDEFMRICRPRLVVLVGDVARQSFRAPSGIPAPLQVSIVHPAAILRERKKVPARAILMQKKAVITLERAFEELAGANQDN